MTTDHGQLTPNQRYKKAAIAGRCRLTRFARRSFDDYNALFFIKLLEHHLDYLALFCRHQFADVVSLDRELPMLFAAIDQHRKLHAAWPAKVYQLVERRADGAARIKDVIDENDIAVFNITRKVCAVHNGLGTYCREIVAVERDVKNSDRRTIAFEIRNLISHAFRERHTSAPNAHQIEIVGTMILFHNF